MEKAITVSMYFIFVSLTEGEGETKGSKWRSSVFG